ncbi:LamG-like jellyroll fold domain-containing protein [Saccharicrinis sp. FJH62]|uniref:LamG-like jellyroll fold domain-containing protein n=1 Tax=Saccharicrinis sp. FJH62 TaxID=3344657 RepID=UPI0035D4F6A8
MRPFFNIKYFLTLLLICVTVGMYSQGFKHPGMLHTNEDFIRIKAQLAANNPAVVAGYNNLKTNEWSQSNVGTWPVEIIKRGIAGDENYINAARGAHAAYLNALRWKISGDVAHANRAVYILNSWADVTKDIGGNTNMSLASGLYGYEFANAAELMRDYVGWKPADFKKFQKWMQNVWYPRIYDFLSRRHDTWAQGTPGHYWSNWGLCNVLAMMSIGILCDDEFIYNQGVAYYKYDKVGTFKDDTTLTRVDNWGLTEFIGNLVPVVHSDSRGPLGKIGQMQESGRDQGHATMALGLAVDICQTAWNQGDDLFGYMDNRLLAGIAYIAAYNSGIDDLPWTEYWYHDVRTDYWNSWRQTGPNGGSRGQFRPYWDRILGHYEGIKGITLNYSHHMADMVVADGGAWGSTSGGYDHLGFSTLTCTRPAISPEDGPLTLGTSIIYNGKTYQQGELSNVTPGSTITLVPLLPDTVVDTGSWMWNTGSTTKDLEISADSSALYRVKYTKNGIESSQLFSISVYGDCRPDTYSYSMTTSDGVVNDTVVTVMQNSKVIMSTWASSWHSTFLWNTGETSGTKEAYIAKADTLFSVVGTNMGGAEVTLNFHIKVKPLGASYKVGDGDIIFRDKVVVVAGQNVTLMPVVKAGMEGGTWFWSSGETTQNLVLGNIQEEKEITVTYSIEGSDYSQAFSVTIVPDTNSFAYWPMDEGHGNIIHDVWAGNDGETNSCGWTKMGANNNGVSFDGGASSYIKLPTDFLSTLNDFTVSTWVKPDAVDTWARVWDFGTNTSYNMFLTGKASDGYVRFAIKAGGSEQQIMTTKTIITDEWTHIAVTKSGNTATMYINGETVGQNTSMAIKPSDLGYTENNYVGKSQWPDPMFRGTIDEFRIYSSAMTKADIVKIMESVKPFDPAYSLNSGEAVFDSIVPVLSGQSVKLIPVFKPGMNMTGGTWLWSDGSTDQNLILEDVQKSDSISVSYAYNGNTYVQTYIINMAKDVTSTYLDNPGFDINCNYVQGTGSGIDLGAGNGAVQVIEGWTRIQNGEWTAGSTYEYGYLGTFNGVNVPSTGSDGAAGGGAGAVGISAGWTGSAVYYQTVTLPAGKYNLAYCAYNANTNANQGECLVGWVPNSGNAVMSSKSSFGNGAWETEVITFTLPEVASGKIQVGLQSVNAGTGDHAKIFIDYVNLKVFSDGTNTGIPLIHSGDPEIRIYPTVSGTGYFTLSTDGTSAFISIYNLTGDEVKQISTESKSITFNLPDSQMYIVKVQTEKTSNVFKIISR